MSGERTSEHLARETDPFRIRVLGMIRKMVVGFAPKGIWELVGLSKVSERVPKAEVYQGLGLWATPAAGVEVEAVVLNINGDADHPIVVALRDERTRKAVADALAADTTMLHNTISRLELKPDGTIEGRTHGGVAVSLCTKADAQNIRDSLHHHEHLYNPGGGAVLTTGGPDVPSPVGTTKLKGE